MISLDLRNAKLNEEMSVWQEKDLDIEAERVD